MWNQIVAWLRLQWDSGKQLQKHGEEIKGLQSQDVRFLQIVQFVLSQNAALERQVAHERELRQMENEALRAKMADEMEKLELRLRLEIAEKLRQTPPPSG